MKIEDFKNDFDAIFLQELSFFIEKVKKNLASENINIYIEYIKNLASNGKRIRPYNAALIYNIYSNKDWHNIKNTLIGIELIHLMALIHDDVMDNSDTRHGVLSAHSYIEKDLHDKIDEHTADHTSRSIAVLLGDLVFSWAYTEFSKDNHTEESWGLIHSLVEEVVVGQMMDVYNPITKITTTIEIERKMLLKTARYTFTRPFLIGASCAQANKERTSWITTFGDSLGLLFQMQDDIFDITKDVTTLKKDPLGDMKNGIHTLLSTYVTDHVNKEESKLWATWFGNKKINNQEEIKLFLTSIGAFTFAEEYMNQKEKEALKALSLSDLPTEDIEKMKTLLSIITKRKY